MVKLNVIYTRTGDRGETGLGDGSRRSKSDARVAAMGDVDETNCAIGLALLAARNASDAADLAIEPVLARIQNDLFDLGADVCLQRQAHEAPGDWMLNRVVEVDDESGACRDSPLPITETP